MKIIKGFGLILNLIGGLYLLMVFLSPFWGDALPILGEWVGQGILTLLLLSIPILGFTGFKNNLHHIIAFMPLAFYMIYFLIYGLLMYTMEHPRFLNQVSYKGIIAMKVYAYLCAPLFVLAVSVALPSFIIKRRS